MRFKELYESENNFDDTYKPCDKCKSFDINCDDCVDTNDINMSDFDYEIDDAYDDEWSAFCDEWSAIGDDSVNESLKKTTVVRKGQKKVKFKSDKEGFRVEMQNGKPKEVKMPPIEIRKRDVGQKRAQIKRKQKMPKAQKLRAKSLIKRKQMGLKSMFAK